MATVVGGVPEPGVGAPEPGVGAGSGESTRGTSPSAAARAMGAPGGNGGGLRDICTDMFERLVGLRPRPRGGGCRGNRRRVPRPARGSLRAAPCKLYVDLEKADHVLVHMKVLKEAEDNDRRPAFHAQYIRASSMHTDGQDRSGESKEDDSSEISFSTRSVITQKHSHEICFGAIDKPTLISQGALGEGIQEQDRRHTPGNVLQGVPRQAIE